MQQMADVTWADGQVLWASEQLSRQSQDRPWTRSTGQRARIKASFSRRMMNDSTAGLGSAWRAFTKCRTSSIRPANNIAQVTGAVLPSTPKRQAERLEKPEAQETYAWLATAEPPRPKVPMGPGTPGQRPEFSPGEIALPSAAGADAAKRTTRRALPRLSRIFSKGMQGRFEETRRRAERYKTDQPAPNESNTKATSKDANPGDAKANAVPLRDWRATGSKPAESPPTTDTACKVIVSTTVQRISHPGRSVSRSRLNRRDSGWMCFLRSSCPPSAGPRCGGRSTPVTCAWMMVRARRRCGCESGSQVVGRSNRRAARGAGAAGYSARHPA